MNEEELREKVIAFLVAQGPDMRRAANVANLLYGKYLKTKGHYDTLADELMKCEHFLGRLRRGDFGGGKYSLSSIMPWAGTPQGHAFWSHLQTMGFVSTKAPDLARANFYLRQAKADLV